MTATPGTEPTAAAGFAPLGLSPELLETLAGLGYTEPTPIQREAIPLLLAGRDLLGQAATGTGKTAAFALPLVQRASPERPAPNRPRALVLVPTRELAMQVAAAIQRYGQARRITVLPIYGGQAIGRQLQALERGVDVVVATPGRALDHLERGTLLLDEVRQVVLDEADEMLDMGFAEDLETILSRTPAERQTALFAATLPAHILSLSGKYLRSPERITIARERTTPGEAPRVRQIAHLVAREHKARALGRVLDLERPTSAIVFCRSRVEVEELTEILNARGHRAEALHGGFAQEHRDRVMGRLRTGRVNLLVATDVAARGLDIENLSHVVNFDVPRESDTYVHRIGRTGRAGREGVAITLLEPREQDRLRTIQQVTHQKIAIVPLPTLADLRDRQLARTAAELREAVAAGGLEAFRSVVEGLAGELDPLDLAAAALKLAQPAARTGAVDEAEIPVVTPWKPRPEPSARPAWNPSQGDRAPRRQGRGPALDTVRLFVGAGRLESLRPCDLVGAIAHESGLSGKLIGVLEIAERFSIVEVPTAAADGVMMALRGTKLRGRKVIVRRDRAN